MTETRVRQVALVAHDLELVVGQLNRVFGLNVGHREGGEEGFGLINAVMPLGGEFLEIVQPVRSDTSAGRYLEKRGGDGGYMMILQCADAIGERARLREMGVRLVAEGHHRGYAFTHYHPADCAGILSSSYTIDNLPEWQEAQSEWPPAGTEWRKHQSRQALGLAAVEIENRDPEAAAERWSRLFEVPVTGATELEFARTSVRFVPARAPGANGIVGLDIAMSDPASGLKAARALALPEHEGSVLICGTWMRPVSA